MKNVELMGLFIKILSVYIFIEAISGVVFNYSLINSYDSFDVGFVVIAPVAINVIFFLVAILMWKFPVSIAKRLMPISNDSRYPTIDINVASLEIAAFTIIGVYILSYSIPDLAFNIGYYRLASNAEMSMFYNKKVVQETKLSIMMSSLNVLIGFVLCIFAGNLKRLILKIRGRL